ncbi:MAG TPA: extracellular solute-binding protein [Candidatus Limnocylindrales bacterium]
MSVDKDRSDLISQFTRNSISRRDFVMRAVGLGLSATSVASVLAACTDDEGPSGSGNFKAPDTKKRTDVLYPEGYVGPIASDKSVLTKDPVTLKVVVKQDPAVGDWAKNAFTEWFEKRTNVRIQWQVVAAEDTMTKVNAMVAAGDLPDVFMSVGFSPAQEMLYGSQGIFRPLNKYIDDYGVEIKRVFQEYGDTKQIITATDGNIYSMPNLNDCYHCSAGAARTWIYKPWLDKLGLSMPQTTAEFENVLRAFKARDPNGNGQADEIPLMGYSWEGLDTYFMGAYFYNPGEPWLVLNNGKVDVTFNKAQWREGLRYISGLFKQGLLSKESFTQDQEALQRIGNKQGEPILGAARAYYQGSFLTVEDKADARWKDYVTVPILKGPSGTRIGPWNYYGAVTSGTIVVTKACKVPELAFMWADAQYELEAILRSTNGVMGEDWRWAKQGEEGLSGKQAVWYAMNKYGSKELNNRTWGLLGVQYRSTDFRAGQAVVDKNNPTFEKPLHQLTEKDYWPYRQDKSMQLPPLNPTEEQAAQIGELATTINNHVKLMTPKFIMGEANIDDEAQWNNYTSTLDRMGLANYLKIYQDAYDKKYKK